MTWFENEQKSKLQPHPLPHPLEKQTLSTLGRFEVGVVPCKDFLKNRKQLIFFFFFLATAWYFADMDVKSSNFNSWDDFEYQDSTPPLHGWSIVDMA